MSSAKHIPPGVSPEAAKLLERAYALDSDEESRALYRDWAETYDETMLQGLLYQSPPTVARHLAEHLPDRTAALLDIGCGTGLLGQLPAPGWPRRQPPASPAPEFSAKPSRRPRR